MSDEQKSIVRLCLWCIGVGAALGAGTTLVLSFLIRLVFGA